METIDFLPLVKAYPTISSRYGEVACIAGVQYKKIGNLKPPEVKWVRLYPVPFRDLEESRQFTKYQPISVRVDSHSGDGRPETRRPDRESIEVIGDTIPAKGDWLARRPYVMPLMAESMCSIQQARKDKRTSLGVFRPAEIQGLDIEEIDVTREKRELAEEMAERSNQSSLMESAGIDEKRELIRALDLIPYRFKLKYRCSDPDCTGHRQSIVDWEIGELYRHIRNRPDWEDRLRHRILDEICGPTKDVALFVGNQHLHETAFLVLGFWWPNRIPDQLGLGDMGDLEVQA